MNLTYRSPHWYLGSSKLTDRQTNILFAIIFRPRVQIVDLIETIWPHPDDEPETSELVIQVTVSRLNKILRPSGFMISRKSGRELRFNPYEWSTTKIGDRIRWDTRRVAVTRAYMAGYSYSKIYEMTGASSQMVSKLVKRWGLPKRTHNKAGRKKAA